jgi:SAM-dependent methyltransferase/uncharacterized protein YbaR (Trm112 family)
MKVRISILQCPYCQSPLRVGKKPLTHLPQWGITSCQCDTYPIVEGIAYIKKDSHQRNRIAVDHIKKHQYNKALWTCLKESSRSYRICIGLLWLLKRKFSIFISQEIVYKICIALHIEQNWFTYLSKRMSWPDLDDGSNRINPFLKKSSNPRRFVDIGSGTGMSTQFMMKYAKTNMLPKIKYFCAIEKNIASLILHQLYHPKSAQILICADVEIGLPFKSESIDGVTLFEVFPWIHQKMHVIKEANRCIKKNGILYISKIGDNSITYGYGISQSQLGAMLKPWRKSMFFPKHTGLLENDIKLYDVLAVK